MGRSNMSSLKITLIPLAICLLLSLNSQISGKPSPKYFIIKTKEKPKKNNDYTGNVNNVGGKIGGIGDGSWNHGDYTIGVPILPKLTKLPKFPKLPKLPSLDYTLDVTNVGGKIGGIGDGSVNSGDYTGNVKNVGGKIGGIGDRSVNSGDYMTIGTANNQGVITENNNHWHGYWGKK